MVGLDRCCFQARLAEWSLPRGVCAGPVLVVLGRCCCLVWLWTPALRLAAGLCGRPEGGGAFWGPQIKEVKPGGLGVPERR